MLLLHSLLLHFNNHLKPSRLAAPVAMKIIILNYVMKTSTHKLLYILPKVLGHPILMKGLTILAISKITNLNVEAYNDILGNCVLLNL